MFKKNTGVKKNDIINIEAGMEGNLAFNSPVNLKINGRFKGELRTKGNLIIGETADVNARTIDGENIMISGKVKGNIKCSKRLELSSSAQVIGDVQSPLLIVNEGAVLRGDCQVPVEIEKNEPKKHPKKKRKHAKPRIERK